MEEWKWIEGYEGLYQISNEGRIKSFRGKVDGRILSQVNKDGWYFTVNLYDDDQKMKTTRIHILVAKAFIGEIKRGYHVHHKDGNKQNNRVDNLEIISPKKHRIETLAQHPEMYKGMNNYNKYSKPKHIQQFDFDGNFIAEYANAAIASNLTGVCQRNILQVANKTLTKHGTVRKQAGGFVWKIKEVS